MAYVLDKFKPLRESLLWELQNSFYEKLNIKAWSNAIVPNFVTSNCFIAHCYARVLLGFMRDHFLRRGDRGRTANDSAPAPIHIIEVGAGHGKLSFLVLKALVSMKAFWPCARPFKVIMSDFTQHNITFWKKHAFLKPFVKDGLLDFALLDVSRPLTSIDLVVAKTSITAATCASPIVVICNYVFDTLPQDAFQIRAGVLHEARCSVTSDRPEKDRLAPDLIARVRVHWEYARVGGGDGGADAAAAASSSSSSSSTSAAAATGGPRRLRRRSSSASAGLLARVAVNPDDQGSAGSGSGSGSGPASGTREARVYYDDADLDAVMRGYLKTFHAKDDVASVLIPVGGLTMLRALRDITRDRHRLLCLAGDKAYSSAEALRGERDPHIAIHGSFSFMCNFDAVQRYAEAAGGFALTTPFLDGFKCCAVVFDGHENKAAPPPSGSGSGSGSQVEEAGEAKGDGNGDGDGDGKSETGNSQRRRRHAELRYQWADAMAAFGPENFSTLQRSVRDQSTAPSLRTVLAVLRLSRYDCDVLYKFKQVLIAQTPAASQRVRRDVVAAVEKAYANYFPLQRAKDVAFEIARLFMGMRQYGRALSFLRESQRHCGEHFVSWYNSGICEYYNGNIDDAAACFKRSLRMRPGYADAKTWLARVEEVRAGTREYKY